MAAALVGGLLPPLDTLEEPFRRGDRAALLERFQGPFEQLRRNHDVTHLPVAVPPATSLLRVHAPDAHGDDLTPYRPMLVEAMDRGIRLADFERGRFGASARAVVPVRAARSSRDSWGEPGTEPERVIGVVDLGFSREETLLADALAGSAVALITLPSEAVADHRRDGGDAVAARRRRGRADRDPSSKGEELARASSSLGRSGQLSRALRLADTEDATLRCQPLSISG